MGQFKSNSNSIQIQIQFKFQSPPKLQIGLIKAVKLR